MQGKIAWFRLDSGQGIITTETGSDYSFTLPTDQRHLQGGDIVDFDLADDDSSMRVTDVRLVERWVDRLNTRHLPLVRQLFETVQFVEA